MHSHLQTELSDAQPNPKIEINISNVTRFMISLQLNPGQVGFYRVQYSSAMLELLLPAINDSSLPPRDRLGLQSDLFALVCIEIPQSGLIIWKYCQWYLCKVTWKSTVSMLSLGMLVGKLDLSPKEDTMQSGHGCSCICPLKNRFKQKYSVFLLFKCILKDKLTTKNRTS